MPAKNSGMRFSVIYGFARGGRAKFNIYADAARFARMVSADGHEANIYGDRFLSQFVDGRLIAYSDKDPSLDGRPRSAP